MTPHLASAPADSSPKSSVEPVALEASRGVAIRERVPLAELPRFFDAAFRELSEVLRRAGAEMTGAPFARYHSIPPGPIDVEVVMPVSVTLEPVGRVRSVELAPGLALQVLHRGSYETLGPAYQAIGRAMVERGLVPADAPREVYLTDPSTVSDVSQHQTLVIQPVRPATSAARA
jgi:effector-binding domain-containing protein